jgi:hypothetical protein
MCSLCSLSQQSLTINGTDLKHHIHPKQQNTSYLACPEAVAVPGLGLVPVQARGTQRAVGVVEADELVEELVKVFVAVD